MNKEGQWSLEMVIKITRFLHLLVLKDKILQFFVDF